MKPYKVLRLLVGMLAVVSFAAWSGAAHACMPPDVGDRFHYKNGPLLEVVKVRRLWRSLKYECVFLNAFETGSEARAGIGRWIGYYNTKRPHSALAGRTPDEAYATQASEEKLAA